MEYGNKLLAKEEELQRATSLRLKVLLGLFMSLCPACEDGRRLQHPHPDGIFWLFGSERDTKTQKIDVHRMKRREYALIVFKRLRG